YDGVASEAEAKASEIVANADRMFTQRVADFGSAMDTLGGDTMKAMTDMVDGILQAAAQIKDEASKQAAGVERDLLAEVDKLVTAAVQELGKAIEGLEGDLKKSAD